MKALQPRSLAEAVEYLAAEPGLRPLAGCTDWMVVTTARGHQPGPGVLDLTRIPELRGICLDAAAGGVLAIGATTPFSQIRDSAEVREHFPALAAAAGVIGGWQIQNRATLGGNLANASPAGDSLPVLLALDAEIVLAGPGGERSLPCRNFHLGYRKTALAPGELVTRLRLPLPPAGTFQAFRKVGTREAQAISKVVVALVGRVEGETITDYRLGAGSVAPTPVRLGAVEAELVGAKATPVTADLAGRLAGTSVTPIDDVRSTAAYRRFALERVVRRLTLELLASPALR